MYPFFFYYAAYVSIMKRNEYLACSLVETAILEAKNESVTDFVRFAVTWNLIMICLFLVCQFALFQRPETVRNFQLLAKIFPIVLIVGIVFAIVNFSLTAASICNTGPLAAAAYVTSFAVIIINALTLIGSGLYFMKKTASATNQVAQGNEETQKLRGGDVTGGSSANTSTVKP